MSEFERARHETVRYHEELYSSAGLGQTGTWLARPHRLLLDALAHIPSGRPVIAYDLGAGIGRHTIPMMRQLPVGSEVYAVDLLPSALHSLRCSVPPGLSTVLRTRHADLDDFLFETPADLVLAFSAIEHLPALEAIRGLLGRVHAAVRPGGVVAIGIVADRVEVDSEGNRRPALLESAISAAAATELLSSAFGAFDVVYQKARPADVREYRQGESYTLTSTLLTWLATRPARPHIRRSRWLPERTRGSAAGLPSNSPRLA
jgi:tellurite methyltransferase